MRRAHQVVYGDDCGAAHVYFNAGAPVSQK